MKAAKEITPAQLVARMDKTSEQFRTHHTCPGKWMEVYQFGQCGRTETLYIHSGYGGLRLEANGEQTTPTEADCIGWFRKLRDANWVDTEEPGEGYDLWLAMIQGLLSNRTPGRKRTHDHMCYLLGKSKKA